MQTLRGRLTAWYSGALALTLAAFAGVLYLDRRSASYQDLDQRIQSEAALRRSRYSTPANAARVRASAPEYQAVSRPRSVCMSRLHDVADPAHRMNELGFAPVVDLLAQPRDHDVHDVGSGVEVVVPRVFRDQRARHDAALVAHEVLEHGVFFGGEVDDFPAAPHLAAPAVEGQVRHFEHGRS